MKKLDRVGKKYGRLLVISEIPEKRHNKIYYKCLCECGNFKEVASGNLSSGQVKSCGCLSAESFMRTITKHGFRKTKIYEAYHRMKGRCLNPRNSRYSYYGGRGISICDSWLQPNGEGLDNFIRDMLPSYKEGLELDRKDNMGNYSPDNCRWVSNSLNQANKRKKSGTICKYKGVSLTRSGKYAARVSIKGVNTHIGTYDSEDAAAEAYDDYIIKQALGYTTNRELGLYAS